MPAGPPSEKVHHFEDNVIVVLTTAPPELGPKVLELRDDPLAWDTYLELARDSAAELLEGLSGSESCVEVLGDRRIATSK